MKAVIYKKKGHPDKLKYSEVDKPVPGDDEVLVKIAASSVNAADYRSMKLGIIPKNRIFGADVSGYVEGVGKNTSAFKPGDEVLGDLASCGFGGFAEFAVAPERLLAHKPAGLSFEEAAALPLAGMTALQALRKGNIQAGKKVLVLGSAGGVGTYAIQLARYFNTEVTGVCSGGNEAQTRALGASRVVDYTREDVTKEDHRYDLIVAVNGNYPLLACRRMLNPGGSYVIVGGAMAQIFKAMLFGRLMSFGSKNMRFLSAKANQKDLEFIAGLAGDQHIKPVIDRQYSLEKVQEAMRYVSAGHAKGKVVIQMA